MPDDPIARPSFSYIDAWGVTQPGKVRSSSQDSFFLGALDRGVTVDRTRGLAFNPAWSPDGRSTYCTRPNGSGAAITVPDPSAADEQKPSRIVVVLDWFEELRERLGGGS